MIKRQTKSQKYTRPSWAVSSSYLIPVFFIVAFAGIGVSLIYGSRAATPCVKQTMMFGANGGCVLQLQRTLNATDSHWGGSPAVENGTLDSATEEQIVKFQGTSVNNLALFNAGNTNGIVDQSTWRELCYADNIWQGSESSFNNAGCGVSFGVKWGDTYSVTPWKS